jgi:hypothetical protein
MDFILKFKMEIAFLLLLIFGLVSCKPSQEHQPDLEFNQAMHYTISIDEQTLFDLASQETLSLEEQLKVDVLLNETPESLSDTLLIQNLGAMGFTKTQLNTEQVSQLQNLFSIDKNQTDEVHECINIYRDILILKQDNQTTEIAKVCLECEAVQFTGVGKQVFNMNSRDYKVLLTK